MKHQLIIVDGQSTVGKSSVSKGVYRQIAYQDNIYWLHEECEHHPIRFEEFEAGDIHTFDGMELNRQVMLKKWEQFRDEIIYKKVICITEGCFLHTLDRYLLESVWNADQIIDYYREILDIIKPLNPLIIFLYRPDIKQSFEQAFKARGDWWRELILGVPNPYGYFESHKYDGDESIYSGLAYEQEQMSNIFNVITCDKLKIDTSEKVWDMYIRKVTETAGYEYFEDEHRLPDVERYCGTYRVQGGEDIWRIIYDDVTNEIYTSLFWPYMPMKYLGDSVFELISFPIAIHFDMNSEKIQFVVIGNYDWGYNGKRFTKIGV